MNVIKLTGGTMLSSLDGSDLQVHGGIIRAADRAAVAALLLHGHPNGFTAEDAEACRDAHEILRRDRHALSRRIGTVAVKIIRLLPDAETGG